MAFVMDPLESVDPHADTTFALMLEAGARGVETLYVPPETLAVRAGEGVVAKAQRAQVQRGTPAVTLAAPAEVALDALDVVWQRLDPPVNTRYRHSTQILSLCKRARVINRPASLLSANEKLYALNFPELMPPTLVTQTHAALENFCAHCGGEMIVKPLDGRGGEGIFHLRAGDPNRRSILETSTAFETRWVMAQAYLPEVRAGDKRILLLDGEPLGALLRVPATGESRANLHSGGRATRTTLDARDREIVARIAGRLRADGLFFVGVDVIGGRLTEINVTSPTGLQEMSALDGVNYAAQVLDAALAPAQKRAPSPSSPAPA